MKKRRIRELQDEDKLTFSRSQIYLVFGCIVAIAVLAFSIGHLISRESKEAPEGARVINPALTEAEVQAEMDRLERRLNQAEKAAKAKKPKETIAPPVEVEQVTKPEKLEVVELTPSPSAEKAPESIQSIIDSATAEKANVKLKKIEPVERTVVSAPLDKSVDVTARKSVKKAALTTPRQPPEFKANPLTSENVEGTEMPPILPPDPGVSPEKKQSKLAVAKPAVSSKPKFTVQVGSFPSSKKADDLKKKLSGKGYYTYIYEIKRSKSVWYRVRVGAFKTRTDAERMAGLLKRREKLTGVIQPYER